MRSTWIAEEMQFRRHHAAWRSPFQNEPPYKARSTRTDQKKFLRQADPFLSIRRKPSPRHESYGHGGGGHRRAPCVQEPMLMQHAHRDVLGSVDLDHRVCTRPHQQIVDLTFGSDVAISAMRLGHVKQVKKYRTGSKFKPHAVPQAMSFSRSPPGICGQCRLRQWVVRQCGSCAQVNAPGHMPAKRWRTAAFNGAHEL